MELLLFVRLNVSVVELATLESNSSSSLKLNHDEIMSRADPKLKSSFS